MSRPATLPVRLASQCTKRPALQCLRQRHQRLSSPPLDSIPRQWDPRSRRAFSTTSAQRGMSLVKPNMQQKAQPSQMRTQKEQEAQAIRSGKYPEDVGLLPDTFILPSKLADRWKWSIRRKWLRTRGEELFGWLIFRFWQIKPKPSHVETLGVKQIARTLHSKMYLAFASGDLSPIQSRLTQGILGSLRGRIAQRPPNIYLHWRLVSHLSNPKLVSYRAIYFPGAKDELATERNAQVQAVVKLHTKQSLQHVTRVQRRVKGKLVVEESAMEEAQQKESVEYVVVQKVLRKGKWGEWCLWGFANETSVEKVEREYMEKKARGRSGV